MNSDELDLRSPAARSRVEWSKAWAGSTRAGLAMVIIAAAAAVTAELNRDEAATRVAALEGEVDAVRSAQLVQARLDADLLALADRARVALFDNGRVPLASVLASLAESLPSDAALDRLVFEESDRALLVRCSGRGDAEAALRRAFGEHRPFEQLRVTSAAGRFEATFVVPRDRTFAVAASVDQVDTGEDAR